MSPARRAVRDDVVFVGLALSLVAFTYTPLGEALNGPLCAVSYRGARLVLDVLGVPFTADVAHHVLSRRPFSLEVSGLCSGLRGLSLWGAVTLLLPLPAWRRVVHFIVGALAVVPLNAARLAHLFYLGASGSPRFSLFHAWIWPGAIVAAILCYRHVCERAGQIVREPPKTAPATHGLRVTQP